MFLREIIIEKIEKEGPLSFRDFMEMALYYPELGYYTATHPTIGKQADYITTPEVTPLFGALIARQLEEMWQLLDQQPFTIVEYGAGTGKLCTDILSQLKKNPALYDGLRYCIIEKSPSMIAIQQEGLCDKVSWFKSIEEIVSFTGCVLTNEVLDNFAVHQVVMQKELMEVFVDYRDGFKEVLFPASDALKNYFAELNISLPENYRTEVNLQALQWLKEVAAALQKGFVITIDYGATAAELYKPSSANGTLLCFKNQKINESYFNNIGRQDITAHVNFSALHHWGQQYGLAYCGYTLQSHFLHSLGLVSMLQQSGINEYPLMIDTAGKFRVLIQQKGLARPYLSGMQFAFTGISNLNQAVLK